MDVLFFSPRMHFILCFFKSVAYCCMAATKKRESVKSQIWTPWLLYLLRSVIEVDTDNDNIAAGSERTGRKKTPWTNTTPMSFVHLLWSGCWWWRGRGASLRRTSKYTQIPWMDWRAEEDSYERDVLVGRWWSIEPIRPILAFERTTGQLVFDGGVRSSWLRIRCELCVACCAVRGPFWIFPIYLLTGTFLRRAN